MTHNPTRTRAAVAGLALALACAGCGGSGDSGDSGDSAEATSPPAGTTDAAQSPAPSPTFPKAADGTKASACRDGRCEILVTKRTKIPIDRRFGLATLSFAPTDLTWRYTYPNGGSGSMKFLEPPYTGSVAGPTAKQGLSLRVVASDGSKAVISLSPGS
ncbi:hypothetical protein [Actinomadura welshii]|uniref:hypothetical protein n=1 Tax=Actinomadura welshii TaxID=3103817 RepID=UPI0003AD544A|nr:hypothetical protein [Actinomadura madurae]